MTLLSFAGSPHGGSHKLLPEWRSQPRIRPVLILDHSIVGSAIGAWWYFHDATGIEAHFIVRGRRSGSQDGHIWQLMDTDRQADANFHANDKAISIETEDDGDPDTQPWTQEQLESLAWLHNKLVAVHPTIRRREATDCDGPGLGYHSKLGAPSCWTPMAAKTCPGKPVRVAQWRRVLLPAFLAGEDLTMALTADDKDFIRAIRDSITGDGDFTERINTIRKVRGQIGELPVPPTAQEIADAVIAALPSGSVDAAIIRAACEQAVRAVFADAASP